MIQTPSRPISREEARAKRQSWYFTGQPCIHGHVTPRQMSNHVCLGCKRKSSAEPKRLMTFEQWEREHQRRSRERLKLWKAERSKQRLELDAKSLLE